MAESVAEPPAEAAPIQFVWKRPADRADQHYDQHHHIADRAIHRPSEDRRASPQAAACVSDRPAAKPERAADAAAPRREPAITQVPLDDGLVIRKHLAAQTGDVLTGQESAGTPPQRLINNPPSRSLSVGNLRGERVTVLGVTEEAILPSTTKGS